MTEKITIAIDAMGGENAPIKNIQGIGLFIKNNKKNDDFFFQIYGDENILTDIIKKENIPQKKIKIFHTSSEVIL